MARIAWNEFTTEAVTPSRRLGIWTERGSDALCTMSVEPRDKNCFNATLSKIDFGALSMVSVKSTAARARGGGAAWGGTLEDCFLVSLPLMGHCVYEQNDTICPVDPGGLYIRDITRPWVQTCDDAMELLILKVPYAELASRVDDPTRLVGTAHFSNDPYAAFALDIIRSAHRTLQSTSDGPWKATLAHAVLDGLRLLYEGNFARNAPRHEGQRVVKVRRIATTYILQHLSDPDLSVQKIAQALGIGSRQLQRAFVEAGETPSQLIMAKRLDEAARELVRLRNLTILEVAFSLGFNDASHFSQSFARRFGVSPRLYRQKALD
jgi:AraC-like DNA-binding protein